MTIGTASDKHFQIEGIKLKIHPDCRAAGLAAAETAAIAMRELATGKDQVGVIFATGASQFETLAALTQMDAVPWSRVVGFHMDEYVGIAPDHPASFRRYLRERLTEKVSMKEFHEIDGNAADPIEFADAYAEKLRAAKPQVCLLGIGENGHLAFNDPAVADFFDPLDAKVVSLDAMCRQQQAAEGWFPSAAAVPDQAITLTIPALLRIPQLIVSVPGRRKAKIVRRALLGPISTQCPATILRAHPNVTLYLDMESAAELGDLTAS